MIIIKTILLLLTVPFADVKIYLFNTVDSPSAELYDCILHEGLFYCRRPNKPIPLDRSNTTVECFNNGIQHSFANLREHNVSFSTILHEWKSSLEKVEEYIHYMKNPTEVDGYVCQCTNPQSFGKNCEYILPIGTSFAHTFTYELSLKRYNPRYVQLYGDVIRYMTIECQSGLLGLDWRDICDGVQQCMSGVDEDNCDKLEYNECEEDEYRCMNGMCIPDEYFLDGDYDCLDWSDELQYYDDGNCPIELASAQCDDRICPRYEFSCGDGQCISDRLEFQKLSQLQSECRSRREQFFICETHYLTPKWTLPNGRCFEGVGYNDSNMTSRMADNECEYVFRCSLSRGAEINCPCGRISSCDQLLNRTCPTGHIHYPKGRLMAPYILFIYYRTRKSSVYTPDYFWLNGTIKCNGVLYDIPSFRFQYISPLHQVENNLCLRAKNGSLINNESLGGYCHNQSLTFLNRSYSLSDICNRSKKCISTYRIKDGFVDCVDRMDETDDSSVPTICSNMQRFRFRCSANEPTCLSITTLGNFKDNCQNKFDELWLGTTTQLADINCNKVWKDQCKVLRDYIEQSWILNNMSDVTKQIRIPFHRYCDTFENLASDEDENIDQCRSWWACSDEQWQCSTGQCIDEKWVLDGGWDCFDGSDEDELSNQFIASQNLQIVPYSTIKDRRNTLNRPTPFFSICNLTIEFPCLPANYVDPLNNLSYDRPCINKNLIGNGNIDCHGGIDERNTVEHCDQPMKLGYNYKCISTDECIPYWKHCLRQRCNNTMDDSFWCDRRVNEPNCSNFSDAVCFNGTCIKQGRCDRILDCEYGEDEYMCEYQSFSKSTGVLYRKEKEVTSKNTKQKLRLFRFPTDANITEPMSDATSTTQLTTASTNNTDLPVAYWCNRGVGIYLYNGTIVCFCPPQYYGDKCQFHSDRITVLIHLNLTQSIYTAESDIQIVLKILILFLFNNETITNHVFHVRPAAEILTNSKKMVYFLYSRSFQLVRHKQERYLNQSNIINHHPYSVRIEIYERKDAGEPVLNALWQYPIYFDYLPVYRFAKVLRLTKPNNQQNPCSSNPCNYNQTCHQLLNDLSKYICLCKSNYSGEKCSVEDEQCMNGYCSYGSICKPDYRGIINGNHLPYCICPFDYIGEQCHIRHDRCASNPCLNDGSCYSTSKPDVVACICTEQYRGSYCELGKPEVKLQIRHNSSYAAAVVQYFDIEYVSLNLILVQQQLYQTLPSLIEYRHQQKTAPEIILIKLYSPSYINMPPKLYLISLHINVTTIYGTTQLTNDNQCIDIDDLLPNNQTHIKPNLSPIHYHQLCQNYSHLMCFHDGFYLCICNQNHTKVECFRYDTSSDHCSYCFNGGQCLKGNPSTTTTTTSTDYLCLCPLCHSGNRCQFNSNSFTFTLDQLFYTDLISSHYRVVLLLLIILPILLFLLAIPNNLFSFVTFRRENCLCNGIGQYLLYMSTINQFNLAFLSCRLIHLSLQMTDSLPSLSTNSMVNDYLCKIFSYLLTSSSRMVYWLSSLVAIERVYMTIFLNGRWLRKPQIARRLVWFTLLSILVSDIHELIFVKSIYGMNNGRGSMCVIQFPTDHKSVWFVYHLIISIMNSILPLLINICCTLTISCIVAKNKINTRKTIIFGDVKTIEQQQQQTSSTQSKVETRSSRVEHLRVQVGLIYEVLKENKELIIGPGITLVPQLFSIPLFIISFTLYCQNLENSSIRYVLILSYFTSFIPQMLSFLLYVYPSSFYSREWHGTKLSKSMYALFRNQRSDVPISKTSGTVE